MRFRIAAVQLDVMQFDPKTNLARAEERIGEAAERGADLVVLPESCVAGVGAEAGRHGRDGEPVLETFRRIAARCRVDLVPGSWREQEDDRAFNTAYYIDRDGGVLARYRKVHPWVTEKPYLTPGDGAVVCDTRLGRVGLAICWDLAFPELFREMFRQRAEIVICPAYWCLQDAGSGQRHNPLAEQVLIDSCCAARAVENEVVFVFCNVAGERKGESGQGVSAGHTQVAVPFLGAAAILRHNRETVLLYDVDTAILDEAETAYEIKKDLLGSPEGL